MIKIIGSNTTLIFKEIHTLINFRNYTMAQSKLESININTLNKEENIIYTILKDRINEKR